MRTLSRIGLITMLLTGWGLSAHAQILVEPAFPNLSFTFPLDLQHAGDGSNRLFVVERAGIIRVFDNVSSTTSAPVFLDIQDRVTSGGERGLLGLAFHPDFANNGFFYVYYTASPPLHSVVARYEIDPTNPDQGDPDSEQILLEVAQPANNHNAGQLAFGPDDGYLYIALGDGGGGGDPSENGQNPGTLLGSLLRIDVDSDTGSTGNSSLSPDCGDGLNAVYAIPPDNPLVDGAGGDCDEIWAYGLRNPWRFSFDPETGQLWLGDVGQGLYEEVDLIEPGHNYGWNTMEGFHCYDPPMNCDMTGLTLPIWEYDDLANQGASITGGHVYRGTDAPVLTGRYIYADYVRGQIWALEYDGQQVVQHTELLDTSLHISSFGVDQALELYFTTFEGLIYHFIPAPPMTRYVAPTGTDSDNDCTEALTPCLTIGHAVDQANPNDTLDVAAGTYIEPGLLIDKSLQVVGPGVVVQ